MTDLRLAIITPTLNSAATLRASMQSVLDQNHLPCEYLIVDGGSCDETQAIVRDYAARMPPIRFVSDPGSRIYEAMNRGIQETSSEWLYFLGSDDVLHDPGVLETVVAALGDADLVYGNVRLLSSGAVYDGAFDLEKLLDRNICHQAVFYRRHLFDQFGLFRVRYRHLADHYFNIQCFSASLSIRYIPRVIAVFNDRGASGVGADEVFLQDWSQIIRENFRGRVSRGRLRSALYLADLRRLRIAGNRSRLVDAARDILRLLWESGDIRLARDAQYILRRRLVKAFSRSRRDEANDRL